MTAFLSNEGNASRYFFFKLDIILTEELDEVPFLDYRSRPNVSTCPPFVPSHKRPSDTLLTFDPAAKETIENHRKYHERNRIANEYLTC